MADEVVVGRRKGGLQIRKKRRTMWSAARKAMFLEALATSCNVKASAAKAKLSLTLVYHRKRSDPQFERAWREAIRQGFELLEMRLLERSIEGVTRPVFQGGKHVGEVTEFDDARALQLLKMHRDEALAAAAVIDNADEDARTLAALTERFRTMHERLTAPPPPASDAE